MRGYENMIRVLIALIAILAMTFDFTEVYGSAPSAFSSGKIAIISGDYKICKSNAGRSDEITERLGKHLEIIYGKGSNKSPSKIGSYNYDILIRWFACLTKYSNVGGDEELGYASSMCDTFADSKDLRLRLKILSGSDPEVKEFRKWLVDYARNVGVNCR
jgi:hypothetical protein